MDQKPSEKEQVVSNEAYPTGVASEKYLQEGESFKEDDKSEEVITHGGDTALANAPWKYKMIALVTALLFPCKYALTSIN